VQGHVLIGARSDPPLPCRDGQAGASPPAPEQMASEGIQDAASFAEEEAWCRRRQGASSLARPPRPGSSVYGRVPSDQGRFRRRVGVRACSAGRGRDDRAVRRMMRLRHPPHPPPPVCRVCLPGRGRRADGRRWSPSPRGRSGCKGFDAPGGRVSKDRARPWRRVFQTVTDRRAGWHRRWRKDDAAWPCLLVLRRHGREGERSRGDEVFSTTPRTRWIESPERPATQVDASLELRSAPGSGLKRMRSGRRPLCPSRARGDHRAVLRPAGRQAASRKRRKTMTGSA
jgi:hypothetical protein